MWDKCPHSAELMSPSPAKDLATIFHLCNIYSDGLQIVAKEQVNVLRSKASESACSVCGESCPLFLLYGVQINVYTLCLHAKRPWALKFNFKISRKEHGGHLTYGRVLTK